MKFKEVVPIWAEHKKQYIKRASMSTYMCRIDTHIVGFFGEMEEITEEKAQEFVMQKLSDGLCQRTVRDLLILLKTILRYAAKKKLFPYIPYDIIFPTGGRKTKLAVLTATEGKKLYEHVTENFSFKNLGVLLAISTGMRIGEICALQWRNINIEEGVITIDQTINRIWMGKGNKTEVIIDSPKTSNSYREVPISEDLMKMMKPFKKAGANPDHFVLTNTKKPYEPRCLRCYYDELMLGLGLPKMKFHGLRHTFATRCIEAKVDVKTVSAILGHCKVSLTFDLYVHPNADQKKKAVSQMFKLMK